MPHEAIIELAAEAAIGTVEIAAESVGSSKNPMVGCLVTLAILAIIGGAIYYFGFYLN